MSSNWIDMMIRSNKQVTNIDLKHFGLIIGCILCGVFGLVLPWWHGQPFPVWPWLLGIPFILLAFLKAKWLYHPYKIWMKLGAILGWVNTRIILGILFFGVILPIGWVMRLIGKDPLQHLANHQEQSYRSISHIRPKDHVERPF